MRNVASNDRVVEKLINYKIESIDNSKTLSKVNNIKRWSCSICGGDSDTGCLYFDPSECPKR